MFYGRVSSWFGSSDVWQRSVAVVVIIIILTTSTSCWFIFSTSQEEFDQFDYISFMWSVQNMLQELFVSKTINKLFNPSSLSRKSQLANKQFKTNPTALYVWFKTRNILGLGILSYLGNPICPPWWEHVHTAACFPVQWERVTPCPLNPRVKYDYKFFLPGI